MEHREQLLRALWSGGAALKWEHGLQICRAEEAMVKFSTEVGVVPEKVSVILVAGKCEAVVNTAVFQPRLLDQGSAD
jgi:hypothetical protein